MAFEVDRNSYRIWDPEREIDIVLEITKYADVFKLMHKGKQFAKFRAWNTKRELSSQEKISNPEYDKVLLWYVESFSGNFGDPRDQTGRPLMDLITEILKTFKVFYGSGIVENGVRKNIFIQVKFEPRPEQCHLY
ncbi:MAG: hypothetical protein H7Y09_09690 [Chitinophagaceae bacterium]|nr:hypothetical protein [Anaerolineae bacterium]